MSNGLRTACWIVAIACVALCDGGMLLMLALLFMEDSESVVVGTVASALSDTLVPVLWVLIPLVQLASIVLGIVVAARRDPEGLRTTRSIMLLFKLGLLPFYACGALIEFVFLVMGFHPILVGLGWMLGFLAGALGWVTMLSGSVWAMATAAKLRRLGLISTGELVAHIILQLIFVADFIDAMVLYASSRRVLRSPAPVGGDALLQDPQLQGTQPPDRLV